SIVQHQGMVQGDIDISSTRYTGTDIAGALDMDPVKDPDEALDVVKKEFKEQFDQTWAETYGFENSYSLAVTEEFTEEINIETISHHVPYADELKFGVDNAWVNREGDRYDGFVETSFNFDKVFPITLGLVYKATGTGNMDVAISYST